MQQFSMLIVLRGKQGRRNVKNPGWIKPTILVGLSNIPSPPDCNRVNIFSKNWLGPVLTSLYFLAALRIGGYRGPEPTEDLKIWGNDS